MKRTFTKYPSNYVKANANITERGFTDIKVGDHVICYDEYSHDYDEHELVIKSIEYEPEYVTETNPKGMLCYGDDLSCMDETGEYWTDDYITRVDEGNFVCIL